MPNTIRAEAHAKLSDNNHAIMGFGFVFGIGSHIAHQATVPNH